MNDKHLKCLICGGDLSDFIDDESGDDSGVVEFLHCMRCGRSYEIADPLMEEKENEYMEYWNTKSDNA